LLPFDTWLIQYDLRRNNNKKENIFIDFMTVGQLASKGGQLHIV
jgi:hypothetical protein